MHLSPSLKDGYCQSKCRPPGSGALPEGIVVTNSNLEMRPLWGFPEKIYFRSYLFGVAVGIKEKNLVDKMVIEFLKSNFTVMLFHYDGVVDDWKDLEWNECVIHVSAFNQTKWWFGKRFLHPDIVAEYDYIFLWDEDLGIEYFHPNGYFLMMRGFQTLGRAQSPSIPHGSTQHPTSYVRYGRRLDPSSGERSPGIQTPDLQNEIPASSLLEPITSKNSPNTLSTGVSPRGSFHKVYINN